MSENAKKIRIQPSLTITPDKQEATPWIVLVVDDAQNVLEVTYKVLRNIQYKGRGLQLECATSAREAKELYLNHPDAALILLDCAMENDIAGLELVHFIRETQNDKTIQIVIRTGQPGLAPETSVLRDYDINDYLAKTSLTAAKLQSKIFAYLRNYETLKSVVDQNDELHNLCLTKETLISTTRALAGSIAHEIRNPLGQVKYRLDKIEQLLAKQMVYSASTDDTFFTTLNEFTQSSQRAIKRGQQIITMLLDEIANKTINTSNFTYFSAQQLTKTVVAEYGYQNEAEADSVAIVIDQDFTIWGDETLLSFVLFNLLKNSLYYLSEKPDLKITLSVKGGEQPNITVHDTGPGIAVAKMDKLFENYYSSGKVGGTGLGLPYCKRVMNAFNGNISCHSVAGEHTEFTLSFPALATIPDTANATSRQTVETSDSEATADRQLNGKTLLVVDDEAINRTIVVEYLEDYGMNVIEANSGHTALAILEEKHCDFVLTDLRMPNLEGTALSQLIRSGEPFKQYCDYASIPIIGASGDPRDEVKQDCYAAGMNAFLTKPIEKSRLIRTLLSLLGDDNTDVEADHDKKTIAETEVYELASNLYHDITTPILIVGIYAGLIKKYFPELVAKYPFTSHADQLDQELLAEMVAAPDHCQKLIEAFQQQLDGFWIAFKMQSCEIKAVQKFAENISRFQAKWQFLESYRQTYLHHILPVLLTQYRRLEKTTIPSRHLQGLLKADEVLAETNAEVLSMLKMFKQKLLEIC